MTADLWRTRFAETSLALRFAVSVGLFGLVVAGAAAALGYWGLARQLDARLGANLKGKQSLLEHVLSEVPSVTQIAADTHRLGDLLIGHKGLHFALIDQHTGQMLASFSPAALESVTRVKEQMPAAATHWQGLDQRRYVSLSGFAAVGDGQQVRFVLSLDEVEDQQLLDGFVGATLLTLPLLLVFVAFGAWVVARTGLVPLNQLTAIASLVTTGNLTQRIESHGLPKELRVLALGFNAMLDRIDEGVNRLSEFAADLAHEMRTPVATLLGRTQVALSRERSVEHLQDVLVGNVEELDRLTRLIGDMLFLAHADQGGTALQRSPVDLALESRRVVEFLSTLADERGVVVEVSGNAKIQADKILAQRAITNLLTNAIRHADSPSVVSVALRQDDANAYVEVSNLGINIPPHQLTRVFERFVRLDAARTSSQGGTGLGLPIVKSIMQVHGGSVYVTSDAGEPTTFVLCFNIE